MVTIKITAMTTTGPPETVCYTITKVYKVVSHCIFPHISSHHFKSATHSTHCLSHHHLLTLQTATLKWLHKRTSNSHPSTQQQKQQSLYYRRDLQNKHCVDPHTTTRGKVTNTTYNILRNSCDAYDKLHDESA